MPTNPLNWPRRGVSNVGPFVEQPGDFAPVAGMNNSRPRRPENGGASRAQLASRPGLAATFTQQTTGPVQALHTISRSSGISGYEVGTGTTVRSGTSVTAGAMAGQFVVLDADWSVRAVFADTRGTGFLNANQKGHDGNSVCFNPTNANVCYGLTIGRDTAASNQNVVIFGINRFDLFTNTITHQTWGLDTDTAYSAGSYPSMPGSGQRDLFPNKMTCNGTYLFVAVFNYVYVFRADNLAYIKRHEIDWAIEVQAAEPITVSSVDYLMLLITGNAGIGGPVVADGGASPITYYGWFYRTGVSKYAISYLNAAKDPVAGGSTVLTRQAMPMGLENGDAGYEDHRYFRISEWSLQAPRGPLPWDMAISVGSDNSVYAYIARTNQGFSYDGAAFPDGSVAYVSACRANLTDAFETTPETYIDPELATAYGFGLTAGGWETDTDSLRKAYSWNGASYLNDIPNPVFSGGYPDPHYPGESPSLLAVAVDPIRDRVYFAGRRPSPSQALPNVYCLRASDGTRLWDTDLKGLIQQNAIAVDPTDGGLICAGNRTNGWEGDPGSQKAELWKLDPFTGAVIRYIDFGDAVNLNGWIDEVSVFCATYDVAVNPAGVVVMALGPYRLDT